jgi:hypothetical protein
MKDTNTTKYHNVYVGTSTNVVCCGVYVGGGGVGVGGAILDMVGMSRAGEL